MSADRQLTVALAVAALEVVAPDELPILEETAEEYFADPEALLSPDGKDEALGFGLSAELISPYVLAAAAAVLQFLVQTISGAVREEARPRLEQLVRRLFRRGQDKPDEPAGIALTPDQARQVREIAIARARAAGVGDARSQLIADAIVGGLVVSG